MKNRYLTKLNTIMMYLLIFACTSLKSFAFATTVGSNVIPFETVLIKFGITMIGVIISLTIIWGGLLLVKNYIKIQFEKNRQNILSKDTNIQVKNIDDAIIAFINKNKL